MTTVTDKKELHKLIAYFVMSDGGVYKSGKSKNGDYYFVMTQREDHLDFCEYSASILENITTARIKYVDRSEDTDANRKNQYRVETKTHPIFTHMRDRIYVDKYKSLDAHYLKMLDWESLAIMYMSDGNLHKYLKPESRMVNPSYNLQLNLKRLSYGDQLMLKHALEEKQMGAWKINRQNQYYYLRLSTKFVPMFLGNIEKYILPSYQYKVTL